MSPPASSGRNACFEGERAQVRIAPLNAARTAQRTILINYRPLRALGGTVSTPAARVHKIRRHFSWTNA